MNVRGLRMNVALLAVTVVGAASSSFAQQAPAQPAVLGDGAGAEYKRVENMHQVRYIEIFLAAREAKTGNLVAACFNTMFSSKGIPASKDTAPQALVAGLDFEKMKKDYGVLGASLNGPKLWLPDWTDIDVGRERDFNGLKAPWVAQLNMGNSTSVGETTPYKPLKGSSSVSSRNSPTTNSGPPPQASSRRSRRAGRSASRRWTRT